MSYTGLTTLALEALHAAPGYKAAVVPALYLPAVEMLVAKHLIQFRDGMWCCTEVGRTLREADRKLSEALFQKEFAGKAARA